MASSSQLRPVDTTFLESAPHRAQRSYRLAAAPEAVFAALANDPAGWGDWFPGFSRTGRYLSPPPHGVGSDREVRVGGRRLVETVIAWEEGRRWAFRISEGRLPGITALAEDYALAPDGSGTRLTWTIAMELRPAPVGRLVGGAGFLMAPVFRRLDRRLAAHRA